MVLGDGARDRGAACELISPDPATGAGVAFVRLESDPDPVRVRAGWVTDADIRAWPTGASRSGPSGGGGGMTTMTAWRTDEPCPVCATGLILHDDGSSRWASAACAAGPTPGPATTRTEVTSDRDNRRRPRGRSGWPCRWPGMSSGTWPSSTAPASAPSSCAAPTSTPAKSDTVLVPCGHTLAHVCPSCAERARTLRAAQCREGWHLEDEPDISPDPATEDQKWWIEKRAEAQQLRDQAAASRTDTTDFDELITELDEEITKAGMRGKVAPAKPARRHRSTRRRQDAPDLPQRKVSPRTVGKTYTAPDGKTFRPSLFVTLTCPSYGRVGEDGSTRRPGHVRL